MQCSLCGNRDVRNYAQLDGQRYFQCHACRLTWLDPAQLPDAEDERAHYDLHENDVSDVNYRAFLRRLTRPLLEKLAPASYGLDFGCGPGPALAEMLSEAGHAMEIYDPFFANDEDLLEEQYDFVTCTEVVEHFHAPGEEFEKFELLLRPGGWLGIMTTWLTDDIDFSQWHYRRDPTHVCFYHPDTFNVWAQRVGWEILFPDDNIVLLRKPA